MRGSLRRCLAAAALLSGVAVVGFAAAGGVDSLIQRAREAEEKERFAQAAALYERALKLDPGQYWATVKLAHDYARLGRLEEARRLFARAKKLDPRAQDAYIEEGYAEADAGNEARAQRVWSEVISLEPSSFLGYHHMGASLARQGRGPQAEHYLRESVKRLEAESGPKVHFQDLMHSLIALGGILSWEGKLKDAEASYREGVERSGSDAGNRAQFLSALAEVIGRQGRVAEADRLFRQGLETCAPPGACFRTAHANLLLDMAHFELRLNRREQARRALDDASRLYDPFGDVPLYAFPFSALQLESIGRLYDEASAPEKAEGVYRRVIALKKSLDRSAVLGDAQRRLADRCAKTGRPQEARSLYQEAAKAPRQTGPMP